MSSSTTAPSTSRLGRLAGPAIILMAAAVATAPLLSQGVSCGDDFDFHLVSWFDCLNGWRHGIVYPHWSPSANLGAGEPRFIFYPPITWMLGAALGAVLPWQFVPVALIFLLLAATGLATRALALETLDNGAATLAGCAALFSGYALFTAYERSAFGELASGIWIPLLLLLILRSRAENSPALWRHALDGSTAPLALVVAGVWLSNVPAGIMACYLLAAVALVAAVLSRSWAPVIRASLSTALGLGLAAIYLVPTAWEQHWAQLGKAIDEHGNRIGDSWLFARHADPFLHWHDFELHRASIIAVVMITLALAGLFVAWRRGVLPANRRWWIPLSLIPPAVLFLLLPISLPVWNLLPRLRFLQFPWRWLLTVEAPMGIFLAAAVWPRNSARRWLRPAVVAASIVVFLASTATAGNFFFQDCDDQDAVDGMLTVYRSGQGFYGVDEYAPPGAKEPTLASNLPAACLVSDPATALGKKDESPDADPDAGPVWSPAQGSCEAVFAPAPDSSLPSTEHLRILATTARAGYLVLRRRTYPAWRVTVNGRPVSRLPQRRDGLMAVPVPQGPVDLAVDWTATPDVIVGRCLSGLALLLVTALCLLERKLDRPHL